jgi:hypothetical protein
LPGREPSRQDTGLAEPRPASTTSAFTLRAGSGYLATGAVVAAASSPTGDEQSARPSRS